MRCIGDPEADMGPVAVFLVSEDARYVTGNTLFIDGGGHIKRRAMGARPRAGVRSVDLLARHCHFATVCRGATRRSSGARWRREQGARHD
jgi:hypothetical protein